MHLLALSVGRWWPFWRPTVDLAPNPHPRWCSFSAGRNTRKKLLLGCKTRTRGWWGRLRSAADRRRLEKQSPESYKVEGTKLPAVLPRDSSGGRKEVPVVVDSGWRERKGEGERTTSGCSPLQVAGNHRNRREGCCWRESFTAASCGRAMGHRRSLGVAGRIAGARRRSAGGWKQGSGARICLASGARERRRKTGGWVFYSPALMHTLEMCTGPPPRIIKLSQSPPKPLKLTYALINGYLTIPQRTVNLI